MVGVIAGQLVPKTVDGRQCYLQSAEFGDRDGPVEGGDRCGVEAGELVAGGGVHRGGDGTSDREAADIRQT